MNTAIHLKLAAHVPGENLTFIGWKEMASTAAAAAENPLCPEG
jgi:hypothetical protein